jgi:hypothetical protein
MNDPTNWNADPDAGSLKFATSEDAKRAEVLFNRVQRVAWNGAIEAAARACDAQLGVGESMARALAYVIRAKKR